MRRDNPVCDPLKDESNCEICGKDRVLNCPVLYGYHTVYQVCFECYEEIGLTINDMIEGIKEANENGKK